MPASRQPFSIHRARRSDLDALVEMEMATYRGDRLTRTQFRRHIDSDTSAVLVASAGDTVLGNVVVFFRRGSHRARLYSLTVAATARGRGIGRSLLDAAEDAARKRHCTALALEVRTDNAAAITLYEARGYRRRDRRAAYYEDGTDAVRYRKILST